MISIAYFSSRDSVATGVDCSEQWSDTEFSSNNYKAMLIRVNTM